MNVGGGRKLVSVRRLRGWLQTQSPFGLPLLAFFALACLSLLTPEPSHLNVALRVFRWWIIEPLLLYFLVRQFLKGPDGAERVFAGLIISGVAIALVGIGQFFFSHTYTVTTEGVSRVISIYNHPDNLGLYLGRVLPLALAGVLFSRPKWDRRRWLYLVALAPLLIALGLSFSRAAWLATALALLVMLIVAGSRRGLALYGLGLALVVAAIPFIRLERITSLFNFVTGSNSTRLRVWQAAGQMLRDHPIIGIGLDQFLGKYSVEYVVPEAWLERFTSHPHNLLLDYWLSLGIMGPVLLIWLLVLFFSTALKTCSKIRLGRFAPSAMVQNEGKLAEADWLRRGLLLGLLGTMADFVAHGLVDNSYFLPDLAVVFWVCFALLANLQPVAKNQVETQSQKPVETQAETSAKLLAQAEIQKETI